MSMDDDAGPSQRMVARLYDLLGWEVVADYKASCLLAFTGDKSEVLNMTHINLGAALTGPGVPVILFEPSVEIRASRPDSSSREVLTELIIKEGFSRLSPQSHIESLNGWHVALKDGRFTLYNGANMWVSGVTVENPLWSAAAQTMKKVLVIYGTELGIARPPDKPGPYRLGERKAEFDRSRAEGRIAAAFVTWRDAEKSTKT
ncbi:hypothetical protein [Frankia sp. EAN1pec]|uniref:hypothetical protein n=1 Tax=Parafrankia sp. (strain EAN1pec) TaxID=298653 RepID=UPI0000540455